MAPSPESPLHQAQAYRTARRAFIAACEKAHLDAVARVHPAKSADGKPLFMDAAALGPRLAAKAVLVIAYRAKGAKVMTQLLRDGLTPPKETRVVFVHALEPAAFAGAEVKPGWPVAMLGAVATEDLSRVRDLAVLPLEEDAELTQSPTQSLAQRLTQSLAATLPKARITLLPQACDTAAAKAAITKFLA
jgi:hypothetical protein